VHVEKLDGGPFAGLRILVRPCGDRSAGTQKLSEPFAVETDARGIATFAFPRSTHLCLEASGVELGLSRPIPDYVSEATVIATPFNAVSVRVRGKELPQELRLLRPRTRTDPCRPDADAAAEFTRSSAKLSPDEALYLRSDVASIRLNREPLFVHRGRREPAGSFSVDLTGGASETIDLDRSEDLHPQAAKFLRAKLRPVRVRR
jgi:hypothetical protein